MRTAAPTLDARFTFPGYLRRPEDERWELIHGVAYTMTPATAAKDLKGKFLLYEQSGVSEDWIVSIVEKVVMVFRRRPEGMYGRPANYTPRDRIPVGIFPELEIDLTTVFGEGSGLP